MGPPISPIEELINKHEKTYVKGDLAIDYLLIKGEVCKNCLIVIFSAFNEGSGVAKTYNYVRTLLNFDCNKLFIKDQCGPQGSYYLGKAPDYAFSTATKCLIEDARKELGVEPQNVICVGSSKGGTSALYHGVVGGYGGVIAGAPQTKIASYVKKCSQATYDYMFDGNPGYAEEGDKQLYSVCSKRILTKVWIVTTPLDWQYDEHILPFLNEVGGNFQDLRIIIDKSMRSHHDIALFLVKNLNGLLVDFLISISEQSWEFDILEYIRAYNASEKTFYDENSNELRPPPGCPIYLQSFDGTFDVPPREPTNIQMARIPPNAQNAIVEVDFFANTDVSFNIFFMQYFTGRDCIKTNKSMKCESGRQRLYFQVALAPGAQLYKTALRYSSSTSCTIKLHGVKLYFPQWGKE